MLCLTCPSIPLLSLPYVQVAVEAIEAWSLSDFIWNFGLLAAYAIKRFPSNYIEDASWEKGPPTQGFRNADPLQRRTCG